MGIFGTSSSDSFERTFLVRLDKALETVARVLEASRQPKAAADVFHRYLDKFLLVEFLTNSALASQISCLQALGLTSAQLQMLRSWASENSVSLQFCAEERCKFLREESRDIEGSRKVEEVTVAGASLIETTTKVVTTVREYVWSFSVQYELIAFRGVGAEADDRIVFRSRSGSSEIKTQGKEPPFSEVKVHKLDPVNMSFLLRSLREDAPQSAGFSICRENAKCRTPTRNSEVEASQKHFAQFQTWAQAIVHFQTEMCRRIDTKSFETSVSAEGIFQPVLPLLEDPNTRAIVQVPGSGDLIDLGSQDPERGATLSLGDANRFLQEERRSLEAKFGELAQAFPQSESVITAAEAQLLVTTLHCNVVCSQYEDALRYVEDMLRKQLVAAIGKQVSPKDFGDYMTFHSRKLFAEAFAPQPFCFAVRRSELHSPEGTVSIEKSGGEPVSTMVAQTEASWPMEFALNASSSVSFVGQHYLHAFLSHQFTCGLFDSPSKEAFHLVSRARQFSSMIVLVGRVVSSTTFDPKQAFIVQNKDELSIGLELSTIPTAREFRDAIESLSPEQQRFAKAIRSMQLESTLFGLVIVHIKPQLEKVLNLPSDSLTKEIKLTQDLMQLFIKYQIPSDLLSFSGPSEASETERLAAVKGHVQAMQSMLSISKKEELVQNFAEQAFQASDVPVPGGCLDMDLFGGIPESAPQMPMGMPMGVPMAMPMMVPQAAAAPVASLFGTPAWTPPAAAAPAISTGGGLFGFASCNSASGTGGSIFGAQGGGGGGGLWGNSSPSPFGGAAASVQQAPQAPPSRPAVQQPPQPDEPMDTSTEAQDERLMTRDYTQLPVQLDQRFEKLETGGALRAAILNLQATWQKKSQKALLAQPSQTSLGADEQKEEKEAAFDLLDALTKSGALPLVNASLHVVVAAVHCFDKTVTETVIQDNMNPIENVERSALIMASTIHQQPVAALVRASHQARLRASSPSLFQLE
mmetsp:Transcript_5914/g.13976  ORF Transcript_5914/g.13976 Transcript_5914/m.13976 type:complete len:977 (-) Transcript_5914:254-3184(-)